MLSSIAHRGPDDEGLYINDSVGLGNRRLSIIDLDGGKQPFTNEDRSIWIVFNGEIYNYQKLRSELIKKNHVLNSHSDTEVIIHLYEEYGEQCVDKLNGMFAFAIWDERTKKLVLARDRIGQKPIYYAQSGRSFIFGSEIKAILAVRDQQREVDYESLHHYLSLRFVPPPGTFFKDVNKLPPAHILIYQEGEIRLRNYWQLNFNEKFKANEPDLLEGLRHKLSDSIYSHMVSDVPVGAFLSGGLDSSMIVAMLAKEFNIRPQTFSIGVAESDFNELPFADMVARDCQTEHHEECVAPDLIQLLPKMIWHLDEPSDPIAACMFHSARLASNYVKVVLGGDGGDELFAGFDRYKGGEYVQTYRFLPLLIRRKVLEPLFNKIPDSYTYKSITQKIRWVHRLSMMPNPGMEYAEATSYFRFSHSDKKHLFSNEVWNQVGDIDATQSIVRFFDSDNAADPVDRMLYTDFMTRLPEHSLMLTDRMTMAHGLEARSPYLDHELVEYLAAFPSNLKIRDRETKYLFRRLAKDYLPETIVRREKQGFMFPVAYWFRNELYTYLKTTLLNSHYVKQGIFQKKYIQNLLEEHKSNRTDHHVRLWMLLNLEIWHQLFMEQKSYIDLQENFNWL